MSTIRKQSIISSGVVYAGIILGILSNYLFAREFSPDEYGLVNGMFVAIGTVISYFAALGAPGYIAKFYPYYKDHLPEKRNDMLTLALVAWFCGTILTILVGCIFKEQVIHFLSGSLFGRL